MPKNQKHKHKPIVNQIIFSTFIHETEVKEKVVEGILSFLPDQIRLIYKEKCVITPLEGTFGNKILSLLLKVNDDNNLNIVQYLFDTVYIQGNLV